MIDIELDTLPRLIADAAEPLPDIDDERFGSFFDRFGDARVICLGEASHGTSEFYRARAAISQRLIERHGFNIVAVEGDWPDCATIDRYVRHRGRRDFEFTAFERFPMWMWRNEEVDAFVGWMREHNEGRAYERMCGFYGLDLYNLSGSISAVIDFLDKRTPNSRGLRISATAASTRGRRIRRSTAAIRCSKAMRAARSASSRC
jgi:erythromycin esterase-like protein